MADRIIPALMIWALGAFAAREAYRDHVTGVGHMTKFGPKDQRRQDDPAEFRSLLIAKVVGAIFCFIAGIVWLIHPWGLAG